jgi:hypothetical protein
MSLSSTSQARGKTLVAFLSSRTDRIWISMVFVAGLTALSVVASG